MKMPPNRYANYKEGNWLKRLSQYQLEGKCNIVIGGQGEAEVNTKRTPKEVAKNLHYVAEQCGYMVGHLTNAKQDGTRTLQITTAEGSFRLVWINDQLERIERWSLDYDWDADKDNSKHLDNYWDRQFIEGTVLAMAD